MRLKRFAVLTFIVAACSGIAGAEGAEPAIRPALPVLDADLARDQPGDVWLAVTTTDVDQREPNHPGFSGAWLGGDCRVYFNEVSPVDSNELRDVAFRRLDAFVRRAGGVEALIAQPDLVPRFYIRADAHAPWRCLAGAIYNMQNAGYPTVGLVSASTRTGAATNAIHIDLPVPAPQGQPRPMGGKNQVTLSAAGELLWNGNSISRTQLEQQLKSASAVEREQELLFEPDPQVPYESALQILGVIKTSGPSGFGFVGLGQYAVFGRAVGVEDREHPLPR